MISRRIDEDSDGDSYCVTYRYEVPVKGDRTRLTHEESVDSDTYQALAPESRITVRYSETNPELVRLEGRSRIFEAILLIGMMLVGGLFTAFGGWQIYSSGKVIYRASMLARHGSVVTGTVTDCWTETDSDGDKDYCVAFCFAEPGQPQITAAEYNRKAYHSLQVGNPVQVRYVPGKPDICSLEV